MTITYAVPDLHGQLDALRDALAQIDLSNPSSRLVFLGDYIDRGPDSAGVLTEVRRLHDAYPGQVVALLGNHETWWLDWLDGDDEDASWLLADRSFETTRSFVPADVFEQAAAELVAAIGRGSIDAGVAARVNAEIKREVRARHRDLITWLRARPPYYETETHLYVHAGVDEDAGYMWKSMTPGRMLTEKYPPSLGPNLVGRIIVAGHVGVGPLHADAGRMRCWDPYVDPGHIYLDGGVEQTGQLNVMRYDSTIGATTFL
ncbi:metallophosphoesterase family protein [Gordonia sp. SND2]|uniref:metallophosphoesterase family protein n=1 Tax=Gordonia sp. SND2 TaxID=3388659 RepID=UPI00398ACB23